LAKPEAATTTTKTAPNTSFSSIKPLPPPRVICCDRSFNVAGGFAGVSTEFPLRRVDSYGRLP
jgi:hypothetical protein